MMLAVMENSSSPVQPIDNAHTARYTLDLNTEFLEWDEGLHAVLGYEPSDQTRTLEWWTDHIHPDDAMVLNEAMGRLVFPWTKEWTVEYRFKKADNTYVLVH